ncbi:hypothetical protein CDAR_54121 [Caerostris darwini]|uniref:Uncharacterized protein n=1 Tax=Caerostris darwini TaxID=1538125 RepID=A0AAV4MZ39_9ARAC|nr:hypothetical protein CDAR_54121 [Caerostris darwini]
MADSNKRYRRLPASDKHRSCSPCTSKNYYSTFAYPLLSNLFPTITYPVGTDASRKKGRGCSRMFYKAALAIDTKTNSSPSKELICLISGGLKIIVTQLAPRTCFRNHSLIITWPFTRTLFQKIRLPSLKHNPPDTLAREKSRN